jgi:putative ABC transport system substrate-binding protein
MGYGESDREGQAFVTAFREGLRKLGWVEGRNIRIDYRWATPGNAEARQRFAKELVALQPDLILTQNTPNVAALLQQTRTIPVVFATASDPVGSGFVASYARPGGNVTGFTVMEPEQGDFATHQARCFTVQSDNGVVLRILPEAIQSRGRVLRGGRHHGPCS